MNDIEIAIFCAFIAVIILAISLGMIKYFYYGPKRHKLRMMALKDD